MALGDRNDFESRSDVDVVAQTLADLKQKPFWGSHDLHENLGTFATATRHVLITFSLEGAVLHGWLKLVAASGDLTQVKVSIKIDGGDYLTWAHSDLENHENGGSYPMLLPIYNDGTDTERHILFRPNIFCRSSFELSLLKTNTDTTSAAWKFVFGQN